MILPFVEMYTSGIGDVNYIDSYLPVLFTLILLMNQIRIPALITINVAGHFKETQSGAIVEAIINTPFRCFYSFSPNWAYMVC